MADHQAFHVSTLLARQDKPRKRANARMRHMMRAIGLARQALGTTSPNPAVGAVVVKNGAVVGSGHTMPPGGNHAEIEALLMAGEAARGATLYTTLEPCCHFGRTPPCTRAIVAAGIKEVRAAVQDPNPVVAGQGMAELESNGIRVSVGDESETAAELYEAFTKHILTGLPFVISKFAMSLDGKIASHTGDSKWVTGPEARTRVQEIRRGIDAVMVGVNTVLIDNPQLTARNGNGEPLSRQPLRVVLDSQAHTPIDARLLSEPGSTLIVVTKDAPEPGVATLICAGAEVLRLEAGPDGRPDLSALMAELGKRGVVSLFAEAGGTLQGALFDSGIVDKVYAFIAPVIIGGLGASSPVEGIGAIRMANAVRMERSRMERIGDDWLVTGYPHRNRQGG